MFFPPKTKSCLSLTLFGIHSYSYRVANQAEYLLLKSFRQKEFLFSDVDSLMKHSLVNCTENCLEEVQMRRSVEGRKLRLLNSLLTGALSSKVRGTLTMCTWATVRHIWAIISALIVQRNFLFPFTEPVGGM